MIDTLMALWNRGYGGRGILVSLAFFLICISISLLLVSVGSSWASWFAAGSSPGKQRSIVSAADLTATAQAGSIHPVADNTASIDAPTATSAAPTARPCTNTTAQVNKTSVLKVSTTIHNGSSHSRPTPTPTHPRPTPTPGSTPTPRITPTTTPTPGITPTATPTPGITPTATPTPGITPTATPTPGITPTTTPTATATITVGPTIIVTAATSSHLRGSTAATPAGITRSRQGQTPRNTDCVHNRIGDSVELNTDIIATLEGSLWLILGGSMLGTLFFYIAVYLLLRKSQRR